MKNKIIVSLLALSLLFTTSLFGDNNYYSDEIIYSTDTAIPISKRTVVVTPLSDAPVAKLGQVDSPSAPVESKNYVNINPENKFILGIITKEDAKNLALISMVGIIITVGVITASTPRNGN